MKSAFRPQVCDADLQISSARGIIVGKYLLSGANRCDVS